MEPWDRQHKESRPAYAAFCVYRDLGTARSTAKVQQEIGKSKRLLDRWSSEWKWVWRTDQYDRMLDLKARDAHQQDILQANERYLLVAQSLMNKVVDRLLNLDAKDLPASALHSIIRAMREVELSSMGVTTPRLEVGGPVGGPLPHEVDFSDIDAYLANPNVRDALKALERALVEDESG